MCIIGSVPSAVHHTSQPEKQQTQLYNEIQTGMNRITQIMLKLVQNRIPVT